MKYQSLTAIFLLGSISLHIVAMGNEKKDNNDVPRVVISSRRLDKSEKNCRASYLELHKPTCHNDDQERSIKINQPTR